MEYNNIYNINFRTAALKLLPPAFRKVKIIGFLVALLQPIADVNILLKKFRKQSIYKVTHNGQVVLLQKVLNDSFDQGQRRIKIVDSFQQDPLWVYTENEARDVYIGTQYVYDDSVFIQSDTDFVVLVPIDLKPVTAQGETNFLLQMKSLLNYYKLASKRYLIKWI